MESTFNGASDGQPSWPQSPAAFAPGEQEDLSGLDTLALLKETIAERVEVEPLTLYAPGNKIRLVCRPDIPELDLRRWQRASLPPHLRKNGQATALDQNQLVIACSVLTFVTQRIEVRDKTNPELWHVVAKNGEPLGLGDPQVWNLFNAMDTQYLVTTIFGRESDAIAASQKVLAASGWTGENGGDDPEDPQ